METVLHNREHKSHYPDGYGHPVHIKPSQFCWDPVSQWGRYIAVGVTTRLRDGQSRDRGSNPGSHKWFSLLRSVQPGSSDHTALYSILPAGSLSGDKAAELWSWTLISN